MLKWAQEFRDLLERKEALEKELKELSKKVVENCPHAYELPGPLKSAMKCTRDDEVCEICNYSARAGY